jgi:acylphosphatase
MKTKHKNDTKSQNNDQLRLRLTGEFAGKKNLSFETYRQAVNQNLTGYIKKMDDTHMMILVAGEKNSTAKFLEWLKKLVSDMKIHILMEIPDVRIEYKEFRIIH